MWNGDERGVASALRVVAQIDPAAALFSIRIPRKRVYDSDMTPKDRTPGEGQVESEATDTPSSPRTSTLSDPLTSALLAEVARNSRTRDFEPMFEAEEETTAERDPTRADLPHPILKRR